MGASFHHLFMLTVNISCMSRECFLPCDFVVVEKFGAFWLASVVIMF